MKNKLTYRQQQFLSQFLDVYHEMHRSLHYGTVAERLGVGKVTAYEMLRLLEEHGLVHSEYRADPEQRGPGRPAVHFYPTQEADRLINGLAGSAVNHEDWQQVKEQILNKLREGQVGGYEELLASLLERIPERRSPLILVTELITTVILTLAAIQDMPEVRRILDQLRQTGLPQGISLGVFSGISMLLSAMERANRRSATMLLGQISRYEEALAQLSDESRRQLGEYTREIVRILSS
jgi:predicted transcriptional regulator